MGKKEVIDTEKIKDQVEMQSYVCEKGEVKGKDVLIELEKEFVKNSEDIKKEFKNSFKDIDEKMIEEKYTAFKVGLQEIIAELEKNDENNLMLNDIINKYEDYLLSFKYKEDDYKKFISRIEEYRTNKSEQLQELLKDDLIKKYTLFRKCLSDASSDSLRIGIVVKSVNVSSIIELVSSLISITEHILFSHCFIWYEEIWGEKKFAEWIEKNKKNRPDENINRKIEYKLRKEMKTFIHKIIKEVDVEEILLQLCISGIEEYLIFLEERVLSDKKLQEIYYNREYYRIEYKNQKLNVLVNSLMDDLRMDKANLPVKNWILPKNKEGILEKNYIYCSFQRCVNKLQSMLVSPEAVLLNQGLVPMLAFDTRSNNVKNKYQKQKDERFYESSIYLGMLFEILFHIADEKIIKQDKRAEIINDGYGGGQIKYNGKTLYRLVKIPILKGTEGSFELLKYYSPMLQLTIDSNSSIRNLLEKGTCKNQTFGSLINNMMSLQYGTYEYEKYMLEMQTGIMSSWKLYEYTYELIKCNSQEIKESVEDLAGSIGRIHSLEVRCYILEKIKSELIKKIYDEDCQIEIYITKLSNEIKEYGRSFNELYDFMIKILWIVFNEQERWKTLFFFQDNQCEYFFKMQQQVLSLYNHKSQNKVMLKKFVDLASKDSKGDYHKWYRMIWKKMEKGCQWLK